MSKTSEPLTQHKGTAEPSSSRQRLGGLHQHQMQEQEDIETIDYKMVTFSLGGKDYGINILKVKEIAKFSNFTYVPNAPPFVSGVYNLRGDIISIIDLRVMFNLPAERKREGRPEDGLILRLEELMIGVVVDSIDKVVGISSSRIQAPHPIFGDVNIKYINGVVEKDGRLYIILDVDRIFAKEEPTPEKAKAMAVGVPESTEPETDSVEQEETRRVAKHNEEELDLEFIQEGLRTFAGFFPEGLADAWIQRRYHEWREHRKSHGLDVQFTGEEDAEEFLSTYYSPYSGQFWGEDYFQAVKGILPVEAGKNLNVWNPGCGKGYETYSLTTILKQLYPDHVLKIWAGDNDLLSISTAPNLVFNKESVPLVYQPYLVEAKSGHSFSAEIKDSIMFEYHDVTHTSAIPEVDIIMARDLLCFLPHKQREAVLSDFTEKSSPSAVLILGQNEQISETLGWQHLGSAAVNAYRKL